MTLSEILPPPPDGRAYTPAELARAIGRHGNTLRKYEGWGFVGPVPRRANGYRYYPRVRALEALFSAVALRAAYLSWEGRARLKALIRWNLAGDYAAVGLGLAEHRAAIGVALERALAARAALENWRRRGRGLPDAGSGAGEAPALSRREAAARIGVAPDTLRDWERNGLVSPVRGPGGRRAFSPADVERLEVVRALRQAGYSLMGLVSLFGGAAALDDLTFARDRWDETLRGLRRDCGLLEEINGELAGAAALG
jgi:DNA-binding transcriptional MerR regulator